MPDPQKPALVINLATRGRPEILIDTIERTLANVTRIDTRFLVSADDDDEPTIDALRPYMVRDNGIDVSIEPREDSLGGKYNRALKLFPDADVYLAMVDYAPHITYGFDERILDAARQFPDGIGVVFNWFANLSFPQINAVTKKLVDLMGCIYPECFPYWFVDHWLDDIARMIDRIAFADVHVDLSKRTVSPGKPWTQEMREPDLWATCFDMMVLERRELAFRIIDELTEPAWRKAMLKRNHPLVEHRSFILNQIVRNDMAGLGVQGEMPERYQRIRTEVKAKVADLLPALRKAGETETIPILTTA